MRRTPTVLSLCAIALLWWSPPVLAEDGVDVVVAAERLAQQGRVGEALAALEEHLAGSPDDRRARAVLGMLLAFDGRPLDGIEVLRAGLTGEPVDLELWQLIGVYEAQLGEDGPTVTRARGRVEHRPSTDEAAERAFRDEHLALAAEAFRASLQITPGDAETAVALAHVLEMADDREGALAVWQRLVRADPGRAEYRLGLGRVQHGLGRHDEALASYGEAMSLDPRRPEPYRVMAGFYEASGDEAKAAEMRNEAAFYAWLPPFAETDYSEERYGQFAVLAGLPGADGVRPDEERRRAEVERLIAEPSPASDDLLAALCWHHADHGPLEDRAFEGLRQRGPDAVPVLLDLLDHGQHTCTIGHAADALARIGADGLLPRLLALLPGDTRPVFPMDIAGALDTLGDPAAVPALIEALAPEQDTVPDPGGDPMMAGWGRLQARQRAALALGAFDTPESKRALRAGLDHEDLAGHCAAALYRLTGQRKHLVAVQAEMGREAMSEWGLCDYLARIDTDDARELHTACSERIRAQQSASVPE